MLKWLFDCKCFLSDGFIYWGTCHFTCMLCWRLLHSFYLMCQWPDVSGPCSVRRTDKTKSSAREKCCLMPCSFKPLSRSNTLSSICFKRQQREREAESCACRKEAAWLFLCCCCFFPPDFSAWAGLQVQLPCVITSGSCPSELFPGWEDGLQRWEAAHVSFPSSF